MELAKVVNVNETEKNNGLEDTVYIYIYERCCFLHAQSCVASRTTWSTSARNPTATDKSEVLLQFFKENGWPVDWFLRPHEENEILED